MTLSRYWIELANMLLNMLIAGQLFCVMYWTFRVYVECFRLKKQPGDNEQ